MYFGELAAAPGLLLKPGGNATAMLLRVYFPCAEIVGKRTSYACSRLTWAWATRARSTARLRFERLAMASARSRVSGRAASPPTVPFAETVATGAGASVACACATDGPAPSATTPPSASARARTP